MIYVKQVLILISAAVFVLSAASAAYAAEDEEQGIAVAGSGKAEPAVIIAVDGHDELLKKYGLSYLGQSTGEKSMLSDGSQESMAELSESGVRGWVELRDGGYKYISADGTSARNAVLYIEGFYYRFDSDGLMVTGWWSDDELIWYYYYTDEDVTDAPIGSMASDTEIDGMRLNAYGIYTELGQTAAELLDEIGWSLKAAYDYSAGYTYYRFNADPGLGVYWFADYGFTNGYGNCYVMAGVFCILARELGYEAYQMAGYVPKKGGGITPHSWCELVINDEIRVFDPNYTNETGNDAFNIYYGKSGSWKYQSYYRMADC